MRLQLAWGAVCAGFASLLLTQAAKADPLFSSAEHVVAPGRSVASEDTAESVVLNPANLSWLPAPELRWTWLDCPNDAQKVGCGHAWEVGTPIGFGFSTALRLDLVQPPWGGPSTEGVPSPYRGSEYFWFTWGLSTQLGDRASFGVSLERSYSRTDALDGLFGVSAALSWRPNTHFGFAAVAHDFNRPSPTPPLGESLPVLDGRYTLAMAFRPTGRRAFEVGLEVQYWQGIDEWTPRATLSIDVPGFGRAYGSVEAAHLANEAQRGVVGSAGLELHFLGLSAGGGAAFGNGLGGGGPVLGYATASVAGYTQPGIPRPAHAVWIRIEKTPSTRGHVGLLRKLWHLANEHDIDAVTLVVRAPPASSFAHAEEIADAIRLLRARGKKVLCSWEDAASKALYACASADRIVVEPGGGLRYAGLSSEYIYLKGLLDKIGVEGDFVRIGPHKSAPEQFTNEHAGPVANDDHIDLLRQQEAVFVRNLSLYRHMSEDRVREVTAKGPFIASEAREAGFVDGLAYDDELERATRELVGRNITYTKYEDETSMPSAFGARGRIGLLYFDGDIVDGRSQHIPLLDMRLVGSYTMADSIRELRDDDTVRAVVLRIESPGGSSLASDVMWRELFLLAKKKPLIVSMGTVAASGGYYIASASKDIFALPLTITGSIGVFYGKANLSGLLEKLGVTVDTYKTAPRADAESMFRGFTPEEERELTRKVGQFYDTFLDRIQQGRGMAKAETDAVGRGRVWTGQQAYDRHLIDHLGGLRDALREARAVASLPEDAPIEELPKENSSLLQLALDAVGVSAEESAAALPALPPALRTLARDVAPLVIFDPHEALARLEYVEDF